MYLTAKLHKIAFKHGFVASSSQCTPKDLPCLLIKGLFIWGALALLRRLAREAEGPFFYRQEKYTKLIKCSFNVITSINNM